MKTIQMDCTSCHSTTVIALVEVPEENHDQTRDPDFNYYCPVCGSAGESREVPSKDLG